MPSIPGALGRVPTGDSFDKQYSFESSQNPGKMPGSFAAGSNGNLSEIQSFKNMQNKNKRRHKQDEEESGYINTLRPTTPAPQNRGA